MSIEKERISGQQLMLLAAGLIYGSILFYSYTTTIALQDAWLAVLAGFFMTVLLALCYTSLAKKFPHQNLVQIHDSVYGLWIGKAISISYVAYLIQVLSFNIRIMGDFYVTFLMKETPLVIFIIVPTLICAYAVSQGVEVLARIAPVLLAIAIFILLISTLLLSKNMNFTNFLPIFEVPLLKLIKGVHIITVIPFGEIVIFLTFIDTVNNCDVKYITKHLLWGLMLGAASFLLITIRNTAVLGNTEGLMVSPSFQASRLINVGNLLTRMDILVAFPFTIMLFLKCGIFYFAAMRSLAQLLSLRTYLPLILPIGGIAIILALIDWESATTHADLAINTAPIILSPFIIIFPVLSLLIAKIRGLPQSGRDKQR